VQEGDAVSESKRLFFAVNLPAEVKEEIAGKLLPIVPAGKWRKVPRDNLHVTMLFLGSVPVAAVGGLRLKAEAVGPFPEFEAEIKGAGHFNGRVLWAGVEKGAAELRQLCEKLQAGVGIKDERFHPHVTLARNSGATAKEAQLLVEKMNSLGIEKKFAVKGVDLMESILGRGGPVYKQVFSVGLAKEKQGL
jgi:2'-5' RNA ligase